MKRSQPGRKQPWPTLDHAWVFIAIALIALRPLLTPIPPHDFWWHMATGRLIVTTGMIPQVDLFSYTQAGEPFYNQSWLAQVLLYGLYNLGGIPLILLAQAFVVALAYGLLLWLCIQRSGALRLSVGLLLLLTLPLSFDNWNVRPQTYALPLFVGFLIILTRWRQGAAQPRLWLLPLLMVIWVNLHGSFVLGGALIALTFGGVAVQRFVQQRRSPPDNSPDAADAAAAAARYPLRDLFIWGGITALALLVNPRGFEVIEYVRGLLGTPAIARLVTEWAPPTIRSTSGLIFFLFVMFGIAVLSYARRPPDLVDMLLAAAFFWLALGAVRSIIWFGLVFTPLLITQAAHWRDTARQNTRPRFQGVPLINGMLMGIVGLLVLLALPWIKPALDLPPAVGALITVDTPVAAVAELRADPQPPQRLFHSLGTGSYLIWAAPEHPVFIDTRIELYPFEQWQDYINLNAGTNAAELLDQYQIDGLLLLNEEQAPLLAVVRDDPNWQLRYSDEESSYFVRR
jgi:hypothetical protein